VGHLSNTATIEAVDGHGLSRSIFVVNFFVKSLTDALSKGISAGLSGDSRSLALLVPNSLVIFFGVESTGTLIFLCTLGAGVKRSASTDILLTVNFLQKAELILNRSFFLSACVDTRDATIGVGMAGL